MSPENTLAKISVWFSKNFRTTLLIIFGCVSAGILCFFLLLQKELVFLDVNIPLLFLIILIILSLIINLRSATVFLIFIPIVLLSVFIPIYLLDYTLNLTTIFALISAFILITHNTVLIIESISTQVKKNIKGLEIIRNAINQVSKPIMLGMLTVLILVTPLYFINDLSGGFSHQAFVIIVISFVVSLVEMITILPFISFLIIRNIKVKTLGITDKFSDGMQFILSNRINLIATLVIIISFLGLLGVSTIFISRDLEFRAFPEPTDSNYILLNAKFNFNEIEGYEEKVLSETEVNELGTIVLIDLENVIKENIGEELVDYSIENKNINGVDLKIELTRNQDRKNAYLIIEELKNSLQQIPGLRTDLQTEPLYKTSFKQLLDQKNLVVLLCGFLFILFLIYLLLVTSLKSFTFPFMAFLMLFLFIPGVLIGLSLTGNPLNLFVVIGFCSVIGIMVTNSVLLIDSSIKTALRPIFASTLVIATIATMITPTQLESLKISIIFSLLLGTFLYIFTFPVTFTILEKIRLKIKKSAILILRKSLSIVKIPISL